MRQLTILLVFITLLPFISLSQDMENRMLAYTNRCLVSADIDGDGDPDLVTGGLNNLQWQKNLGDGTFRNYLITPDYNDVRALHVCDFDGDNDMDILASSYTNNRIVLLQNNGNQVFTEFILSNSAGGTEFIDVADMDNDGDPDIVGAAFDTDLVYLLTNNGGNNFTQTTLASGLDGAYAVSIADFDNNGFADIAAAAYSGNSIVYLQNSGNGTFLTQTLTSTQTNPYSLSISDLDNDGDADLLYTSAAGYGWFSNNAGTLTQNILTTGAGIRELIAADLDNDGHKDLVVADYDEDKIIWRKNNGNQTFGYNTYIDFLVDYASMLQTGDFNNDGFTDIVSGSSFDLKYHRNSATQSFTNLRIERYLGDAAASCTGDFDGDGDNDVIAVGSMRILFIRNDGDGIFNTNYVTPTNVSMSCNDIHAADMDGDGDTDAVFTADAYGYPGLSWIENLGGGEFDIRTVYGLSEAQGVFPVDFDFDGDMDVVATTLDGHNVHWYENNGNEDFTQHLVSGNYYYPLDVAAFDYENDGLMDVVVAYGGSTDKVVLHRNQDNGFVNWVVNSNAYGANSVAVMDMDGDGDIDILSSTYDDNKIIWYEHPNYTPHVITSSANGAIHVDAGDFDGDGDADVVSCSTGDNNVSWYRNSGSMSFTRVTLTGKVPDPTSVSAGDINGDGVPEMFSTCKTTHAVAMYGAPLSGPPLPLTDCGHLIISEYIEGSSNNKVIEIYNPTSQDVDLSSYSVAVYQNGSVFATQSVTLQGILQPLETHVIAHPSSNAAILALAGQSFGFGFNGNDAIALLHNDDKIDILGKIGQDPGTQWSAAGVSTLNMTLVRKNSVTKGINVNPATFDPSLQWDGFPQDNISNLGAHTSVCSSICVPAISITASETAFCSGTAVTFTASCVNQGSTPVYQWKLNNNNTGTNSPVYTSTNLAHNDQVLCELTSSEPCAIVPDAISNSIVVSVTQTLTPSVSISATATSICQGTAVTFTATPVNGGSNPQYQWRINGNPVQGATQPQFTSSSLSNADAVSCALTSSEPCVTAVTVVSAPVTLQVNPYLTPSVSISASQTAVCAGTSITFTATPLNGGSNPVYQWLLNGYQIQGATQPTYSTTTLADNDVVSCRMTSNAVCTTVSTVYSQGIAVSITPVAIATVSISASQNGICSGDLVIFTATPVNGGTQPAWQWKKNGIPVTGAIYSTYESTTLVNNEVITCEMSSSLECVSPATAISNAVTMQVNNPGTPGISINASQTVICEGTEVTFTATATLGGSSPAYQWFKNGEVLEGATQPQYITSEIEHNDQFYCTLESNAACITTPSATSNILIMTISEGVIPSVSIVASQNPACTGTEVVFTALLVNGGIAPQWQWRKNGTVIPGAVQQTYSTFTLSNNDMITCDMVSNAACLITPNATSNVIIMGVYALPEPEIVMNWTTLQTVLPYQSYQWYFEDEVIPGADQSTYEATENGSYRVGVSDNNGCSGMSEPYIVLNISTDTEQFNGPAIVPNPNNGQFVLHLNSLEGKVERISIYTATGQLIWQSSNRPQGKFLVPGPGHVRDGMYIAEIIAGKTILRLRYIVVQD
ncbi:MAG: VCBS repeat-containing protein [Bacteroidales bacterium]|nr:VCBS repeat-containing protein [Bacteroidales bacterium]